MQRCTSALTRTRAHTHLHKVRVAVQRLLGNAVRALLARERPHDDRLVAVVRACVSVREVHECVDERCDDGVDDSRR